MRNNYSFAFIAVFLGLLLAQAFPLGPTLSSRFDSFPARDRLVTSVTEFRLWMGDRVFNNVLVGADGWLVYATDLSMDKFQNVRPMSEAELAAYEKSLLEFQSLVEAYGGQLLFVAAPYKNTIYPEFVPAGIQRIGHSSRLDQIVDRLNRRPSLRVLDLRPSLLEARQEAQIYYTTDTHWNDLGSFFAYQAIIQSLQPSFPELSPRPLSDFKLTAQAPRVLDLGGIIGSVSLTEERVALQPRFKRTARLETMILPSGRHLTFARGENSDLPVALFLHDSFLYSLMQYLSEHFSRTYYVDVLAGNDMLPPSWVEQLQPDVVVIVLNEHFLDILPHLLEKGRPDFDQFP